MKWAFKLGRLAGIAVYVHATFFLLILWLLWVHWRAGDSAAATVSGIAFVLSIFACVVLHELGHALAARRYGVRTRDIVLLPIGGVARLERIPENPVHELVIAVAGPAVNVVIAAVLFFALQAASAWVPIERLDTTSGPFLERLLAVNVFLVLFNLLPAFPMDGGRILRAGLALRMEHARATQVAAGVGQALALLLGFAGLFGNPFLVFIALFVWIGAGQEAHVAQFKHALGGIPLRTVMITDFRALRPDDTLGRAVELTLAGSQTDFPVVEDGRVVGVLTQPGLLRGLEGRGRGAAVAEAMERSFEIADISEMAESVFLRLQTCNCHTIPVVQRGELRGLVTMENLGEFLRIQGALGA